MDNDTIKSLGISYGNIKNIFLHFGDNLTDANWMALLICILNEKYTTVDALVAMGVINSRESFEGDNF